MCAIYSHKSRRDGTLGWRLCRPCGTLVRVLFSPSRRLKPSVNKMSSLQDFSTDKILLQVIYFSSLRGYQEIKHTKNSVILCVFSVKLRVINIVTQRTTEDAQRHTEDKLHQLLFDNSLVARQSR